jgi:predicted GIY-YIG superfamily endonuclease
MNYVGYVYKCVNVFNEKVYIGITIESLEERKRKHISDTLRNKDKCHFHRALRNMV